MQSLILMLDRCHQLQISLNLKKCIFCTPFGTLLRHVVCKEGLLVDQAKIVAILGHGSSHISQGTCTTLGHTGYYRRFIQSYAKVIAPLEKLLRKDTKYLWTQECQEALDTLKEKLVTTLILVFPDWTKIFHVHVDASSIALGTILMQTQRREH
jgi:hypothetical protein